MPQNLVWGRTSWAYLLFGVSFHLWCGYWLNIILQVERKKYIVMNEKQQKCMCMPNFFPSLRGLTEDRCHSLKQLSLKYQALRLRANPRRLHRAIHLSSINRTYSDTGFYKDQTSYLNMKILTFAIDEKFFKPLLIWVMVKMLTLQWPHKIIPTCSSGTLYKGKYTVIKLGLLATTFW